LDCEPDSKGSILPRLLDLIFTSLLIILSSQIVLHNLLECSKGRMRNMFKVEVDASLPTSLHIVLDDSAHIVVGFERSFS
jgi:hypothetical protein